MARNAYSTVTVVPHFLNFLIAVLPCFSPHIIGIADFARPTFDLPFHTTCTTVFDTRLLATLGNDCSKNGKIVIDKVSKLKCSCSQLKPSKKKTTSVKKRNQNQDNLRTSTQLHVNRVKMLI